METWTLTWQVGVATCVGKLPIMAHDAAANGASRCLIRSRHGRDRVRLMRSSRFKTVFEEARM